MNISGLFFDAHFPWSHPSQSQSHPNPPSQPPTPDPSTDEYPSSSYYSHRSSRSAHSSRSVNSVQATYNPKFCTCTRCILEALHDEHVLAGRRCLCHNLLCYPYRRKYVSSIRPSILSSLAPQLVRDPEDKPEPEVEAELCIPHRYGRYEQIDMHESVSTTRSRCWRRRTYLSIGGKTERRRRQVYKGLVQVVEEDDMVTAENRCTYEKLQVKGAFENLYNYFQHEDDREDSGNDGALKAEHEDRGKAGRPSAPRHKISSSTSNEDAIAQILATDLAYSSLRSSWHSISSILSSSGSFRTARTTLSDADSVELGAVQLEKWDGQKNTVSDRLMQYMAGLDQRGFHPTLLFGMGLVLMLRW